MDILRLLAEYAWAPARGLSMVVPFYILGRLQRELGDRLSLKLAGTVYILVITFVAIVSNYSEAVLWTLLPLIVVALLLGRYARLSRKVDGILLSITFAAIAIEPVVDAGFRSALVGELRITYDTVLAALAFDLVPVWMRSYSVGLAGSVDSPSILLQILISILVMTVVFVASILVLRRRSVVIDVCYQWAAILALGAVFLVVPNHLLIPGVVVLALYLGVRCHKASVGLSHAWVFQASPARRGIRLWLVIALYLTLYHLIYARAVIGDFGRAIYSFGPNWVAVCSGMSVLSLGVGMLLGAVATVQPLDARKAFGVLQICIGILGFLALSAEVFKAGISILLSPEVLLLALVLVYAVPGLLAGIALVTERSWARAIGIGVSIVDLVVMPFRPFPVGLLAGGLGIFALWSRRGGRKLNRGG